VFFTSFSHGVKLLQQHEQCGVDLVGIDENSGPPGEFADQTSLLAGVRTIDVGLGEAMAEARSNWKRLWQWVCIDISVSQRTQDSRGQEKVTCHVLTSTANDRFT
jgi:hypothetical protein